MPSFAALRARCHSSLSGTSMASPRAHWPSTLPASTLTCCPGGKAIRCWSCSLCGSPRSTTPGVSWLKVKLVVISNGNLFSQIGCQPADLIKTLPRPSFSLRSSFSCARRQKIRLAIRLEKTVHHAVVGRLGFDPIPGWLGVIRFGHFKHATLAFPLVACRIDHYDRKPALRPSPHRVDILGGGERWAKALVFEVKLVRVMETSRGLGVDHQEWSTIANSRGEKHGGVGLAAPGSAGQPNQQMSAPPYRLGILKRHYCFPLGPDSAALFRSCVEQHGAIISVKRRCLPASRQYWGG